MTTTEETQTPLAMTFNIVETAKMLGMDRSTLWRLAKRGVLTPDRTGSSPIYNLQDIEKFLAATSEESPKRPKANGRAT